MEWRRPGAWELFAGLCVGVPCLFFYGPFPTFYPLALMVAALMAQFAAGDGNVLGALFATVVVVPQVVVYAVLLFVVASRCAIWMDHGFVGPAKHVIVASASALLLTTWSLPVWGSRGFVDPHPLQTMFQLIHRFPSPGI